MRADRMCTCQYHFLQKREYYTGRAARYPTQHETYHVPKLPADANFATIVSYTKNDKKAIGGKIKFILLETIGHAYIDMDVSEEDMLLALKELQERYQDEY